MRRVTITTEIAASAPSGPLILRHPRWADYDDWVRLREDSADMLKPWEPEWTEAHLTRGSYRLRLNRFKRMVSAGSAYPFHIFRADTETLIGACNLTHVERAAAQSAKLGYWIARRHNNRGHGTAAVAALTRFGFDTLGLHRIEASVQPDNAPSLRLLEKLGFQPEGVARGLLKIDGAWADHAVYARLSSD